MVVRAPTPNAHRSAGCGRPARLDEGLAASDAGAQCLSSSLCRVTSRARPRCSRTGCGRTSAASGAPSSARASARSVSTTGTSPRSARRWTGTKVTWWWRSLNLFGYTGSFTCAAAAGGARRTVTVDTSAPYLAWAGENLALNGLAGPRHELVREDARDFLARCGPRFTLCMLDPPSFSSRAGAAPFDVQRDHRALVEAALAALEPGGVLYFSTNHQRFEPRLQGLRAEEITRETAPPDYRRTPHRCFRIVPA